MNFNGAPYRPHHKRELLLDPSMEVNRAIARRVASDRARKVAAKARTAELSAARAKFA